MACVQAVNSNHVRNTIAYGRPSTPIPMIAVMLYAAAIKELEPLLMPSYGSRLSVTPPPSEWLKATCNTHQFISQLVRERTLLNWNRFRQGYKGCMRVSWTRHTPANKLFWIDQDIQRYCNVEELQPKLDSTFQNSSLPKFASFGTPTILLQDSDSLSRL